MSDHAEIIRAALEVGWKACWEAAESVKHAEQIRLEWQGYVAVLDGLLADHAAETERLRSRLERQEEDLNRSALSLALSRDVEHLEKIERELVEARAENERLREQVLPGDMVCACLDETGSRTVTVWERCERCHAFMRMPDALAAAQEPPHCTCQSSWPSDLRCPACEAAAQEPPAADEFAGLADVTRVLPVVAEFVEKHGRLPIDLAEATNGPQPPADGGDRDA